MSRVTTVFESAWVARCRSDLPGLYSLMYRKAFKLVDVRYTERFVLLQQNYTVREREAIFGVDGLFGPTG